MLRLSPTALLILSVSASIRTSAQDLEQVGKGPAITWNGGVSAFTSFYATDRDDPRRVPLTWGISGRLNLSIYQLQIPLSFVISEKDRDFRQPFNQYGLSPRYKWIRAHIGHRTMNFSELTLASQRFFGGGIELDPGKFRFAAMYGKLRREIFTDTTTLVYVQPSFDRKAMAARIGVGSRAQHIDLIVFKGKDHYEKNDLDAGKYGTLQPKENLVVGLDGAFVPFKGAQFEFNGAVSLLNNGFTPETREGSEISNNFDSFLMNVDQRTRRGTAIKTGLSYNIKGVVLSLKYDRISPLFETLGNYYFMNDLENYRGSVAWGMFKQKLRLSLTGGYQHNDLGGVLTHRTRRTIGSATMSYNSGKAYSAQLTYSNFEADLRQAFNAAETDTIRLKQVSHNASLNQSVRIKNKEAGISRTITLALSFQQYNNSDSRTSKTSTNAYTGSLAYRHAWKERSLSLGARTTFSKFVSPGLSRDKYGLSLNTRKGFFDDRTGVNVRFAFYMNRVANTNGGISLISAIGVDQKVGKGHSFGLSFNYNSRQVTTVTDLGQYQVRGQLTYAWQIPQRKKSTNS